MLYRNRRIILWTMTTNKIVSNMTQIFFFLPTTWFCKSIKALLSLSCTNVAMYISVEQSALPHLSPRLSPRLFPPLSLSVCLSVPPLSLYIYIYTRWNDKIVFLKKTKLQLYFKTFIKIINSGNLIIYYTSIQCSCLQLQSPPRYGLELRACLFYKLSEYSADGSDQAGFGVVGGHVDDVALFLKPTLALFGLVGRRRVLLPHPGSATGHLIALGDHHTLQHFQVHFGVDFQADRRCKVAWCGLHGKQHQRP